ncbi:MAG: imidazole glycerol phosphate synthase subunit HisH [Deltaproteobacteria bacterium]|nr:imidazole glycerol phosphate synthase subunit HisH [Deltaproteobacteria bacterium]
MTARAPETVLLDVGLGNLRSVERALRHALPGTSVRVTRDAEGLSPADTLVFPGQGAFGDASRALGRDGGALALALRAHLSNGGRYLGLCLGLQVLFDASEEAPGCPGLGVFPGSVLRFREGLRDETGMTCKVPHVGWNKVTSARPHHAVTSDWYYFVHGYHVVPEDPSLVLATASHGEPFTAAVSRGNLLAVQFHPEKSARAGLSLLRAFLSGAPS